jgi:hypothetical protein
MPVASPTVPSQPPTASPLSPVAKPIQVIDIINPPPPAPIQFMPQDVSPAPEPSQPVPEVVLPTPPDEVVVEAPKPAEPAPETPPASIPDVGPNLAQALADEEKAVQDKIDTFISNPADSLAPTIANGVVQPEVAAPTSAPPKENPAAAKFTPPPRLLIEPEPAKPPEDEPSSVQETIQTPENSPLETEHKNTSKRIIQPINNLDAPDLNALLAAEEAKEAVASPAANTVIIPVEEAPTPDSEEPITPTIAPKDNIDHNSIAL